MKKLLVSLWNKFIDKKNEMVEVLATIFDFFYSSIHKPPMVASVSETIEYIVNEKCSISRFGDGEIKLVAGKNISFQKATPFVIDKLREVLSSDSPGHIVCIADIFGDRSRYSEKSSKYWEKHLHHYRRVWYKYIDRKKQYYNASMTRQYFSLKDRSASKDIFAGIKKIWDGRDVVFIEGEKSRMGVGNDLFANAKSVRRILGPSAQAFLKYDELLSEARKLDRSVLILLALGPCATALSYDLHLDGYQAVDIGHVDIEYEWFLSGATCKVPIKNKLVYEAMSGEKIDDMSDEGYLSQIIAKVTQ